MCYVPVAQQSTVVMEGSALERDSKVRAQCVQDSMSGASHMKGKKRIMVDAGTNRKTRKVWCTTEYLIKSRGGVIKNVELRSIVFF